MINAIFFARPEEGTITMRVSGHAQSDEKGKDLICASASILAMTLAYAIGYADTEKKFIEDPDVYMENGRTRITVKPSAESFAEILHAFFIVQIGFCLLSDVYPDRVSVVSFNESVKDFINKEDPSTLRTE